MKYYSEQLNKIFDSEKACIEAEHAVQEEANRQKILKEREEARLKAEREKASAERKAAADRVEAARKTMVEAQNAYRKELESFIEKYKTYHFSTNDVKDIPNLFSIFDIPNVFNLLT